MAAPAAGEDIWTIGRLLDWTQQFFGRKKIDSPRLDAELLLAHVLDCTRIELYTNYDAEVGDTDRSRFKELVRRRSTAEPVAYLIGQREFYGLPFSVVRDVLIPRPETEHLVDAAIAFLKQRESPSFVDVGTGSGCIAVAIASEVPGATGLGVDVCARALAVAVSNSAQHQVADRIGFRESDLFATVPEQEFDLIASNPPYVSEAEWAGLAPDVRDWEPRLALLGGHDGLEVYRRLVPDAAPRLKLGGRLLLEIGHRQEREVASLVTSVPAFKLLPTVVDFGGHPRVIAAERL